MVREAESPIAKYTDIFDPQSLFIHNDGMPIKIWLSLQCPARSTFSAMIKEHGGRLCPSENGADVKIGDHLKSVSSQGQISYKWIEDSIGDGIVKDVEDYKIVVPAKNVHKATSSRRTEFSPADDAILLKFIKKQSSLGAPLSGNNIYESLAEMYPHHPAQSWRNRWVKVLSQRPGVLANTEISGRDSHAPRKSIGFTREHDTIILQAVRQPDAEPMDPEWWERFALKHVSYGFTNEQWKSRYFDRLLPVINGTEYFDRLLPEINGTDNDNTQVKERSLAPTNAPIEVTSSKPNGIARTAPAKSPVLPRNPTPQSPEERHYEEMSKDLQHRHYEEMTKNFDTKEPQEVYEAISKSAAELSKSAAALAMKTPVMHSEETWVPATNPVHLQRRRSYEPPRATSVPAGEHARNLFSRPLPKSSSLAPPSGHKQTHSGQSQKSTISAPAVAEDSIIYQNPTSKAMVWKSSPKTPIMRMDDDDHMVHQQIQRNSGQRTNKVRVSLGDINIEIESNGDSPGFMITPNSGHSFNTVSPEPSRRRQSRLGSAGASSRKATGGEIPSTPGSSPIKLKSESLATLEDEEGLSGGAMMMDIDEDVDLREPLSDGNEPSGDIEMKDVNSGYEPAKKDRILPEMAHWADEEIPAPSESAQRGLGISGMGQETQALFSADEDEDLSIPKVEITPSPAKANGIHPKTQSPGSKWIDTLDSWVSEKAVLYSISPEVIYHALERTGCKKKLTIEAVRYYTRYRKLPKLKGLWTFEEDDTLTRGDAREVKKLDRKHGYGSAAERRLFLNVWTKTASENPVKPKFGFGGL